MTEEEDIDGLAAEYALGSLDVAERKQVAARRKTDASLHDAIESWQHRLAPLSQRLPGDLSPSARYWERDIVTPAWSMDAASWLRRSPNLSAGGRRGVFPRLALATCVIVKPPVSLPAKGPQPDPHLAAYRITLRLDSCPEKS